MIGFKNKKYSLLVLFVITCHLSKAQNNENFYRSMIRENLKLSTPLLPDEQLPMFSKQPESPDSSGISQSLKKKLLLYSNAYFMYDNSALAEDFDKFLKENPHSNLPEELTKSFTNDKPGFEESYNNAPVFVNGKWVPRSSLFGISTGGGFSPSELIGYLKSQTPREKRKRKYLKIITEIIYPTE